MADAGHQTSDSGTGSHVPESSQDVSIRFLSPSSPEITLSKIDLDTKVGALKTRLSLQLPGAPKADKLRLIYFGRPLLDMEATLRTVLGSELKSSPQRDTFTLHVIVQPSPSDSTSLNDTIRPGSGLQIPSAAPNLNNTTPHGLPPPPLGQTPVRGPPVQGQPVPSPFQPQLQRQQVNVGQNPAQLHAQMIQQTMQHHLQHQLHAIQQQIQQNMIPTPAQNLSWPQMFGQMPQMAPMMPGIPPGQQPLPNLQNPLPQQQQQQQVQQQQPRATGSSDDTQTSASTPENRPPNPGQQPGQITNAQAAPQRQTSVQEMLGPGGQRMRVTATVESRLISRSGTPQSTGTNNVLANTNESNRAGFQPPPPSTQSTTTNSLPSLSGLPPSNLFSMNMPMSSTFPQIPRPMPTSPPSNTTTAWLLSSPRGPQAIVFSPEHGMYRSHPQPSRTRPPSTTIRSTLTNRRTLPGSQTRNGARRPHRQQNPGAAPLVVRRRIEVRQNQDLLGLIVSRLWLFVRLYVFALMFTEPGSWLRWCLLGGAAIYCCTPPNNFFQEQLQRLQRHFEGLVPLAPPPAAADTRPPPQNNNNGNPNNSAADQNQPTMDNPPRDPGRSRPEPTPEAAAQRILQQQQQQRNANTDWWVQTTRRVERAVWLFVASLIPGVGERHIRATNEAAEAAARAEREALEQQQQQQQQDGNADGGGGGNADAGPGEQQPQQQPPPVVQV